MIRIALVAGVVALSGCAALQTVGDLSEEAIERGCEQSESLRRLEREQLADWGLWAKCVDLGTVYEDFELVAR